ncbi:MAG: hypothetical protein IBJ12_05650 [Sphingomonadaceae bacterium]|nr:hypothetical protein [Sphingomonadaceae bacterium]
MSIFAFRSLFVFAISASSPVVAKSQENESYSNSVEQEFSQTANCIVQSNQIRPRAFAVARMTGTTSKDDKSVVDHFIKQIKNVGCFRFSSKAVIFDLSNYRSALFSALYRTDFGAIPPPKFEGVPELNFHTEYDQNFLWSYEKQIALRKVGDCIARANPTAAHLFAISLHPDEEQIDPSFRPCLGMRLPPSMTPWRMRGVVAEAMYKLRIAQTGKFGGADA